MFRLRWKISPKVLKTWQKSAQVVIEFLKKCLKFRNSARKFLVVFNYFLADVYNYRIYSINHPGRLLNFWTLRGGAYSRWALIPSWALIKFSPFSASVVVYFATKQ